MGSDPAGDDEAAWRASGEARRVLKRAEWASEPAGRASHGAGWPQSQLVGLRASWEGLGASCEGLRASWNGLGEKKERKITERFQYMVIP